MVISLKDASKLFILSVIACCAAFLCVLFINYQCDLAAVEDKITSPQAMKIFDAQKNAGVMVCAAAGGCMLVTAVVMMIFYIKHYIDVHKKELGILKALGYPRMKIAKSFFFFGVSVLIGTGLGFGGAFCFMNTFYDLKNSAVELPESVFPKVTVSFHPELLLFLVILPAAAFGALAVFYAFLKLKMPVLYLIKDNYEGKKREKQVKTNADSTFIQTLRSATVKSRKSLIFFMIFASFCFSAMTQMSVGMYKILPDNGETFGIMMLAIGLVLAFSILFLAITTVISANNKTIAMMKVFGYPQGDCRRAILGGYRPLSYIGFAVGTGYQFLLIKLMIMIVFAEDEIKPEYNFDLPVMFISLGAFIVIYEALMLFYSGKIKRVSLKEIMLE